jgi:hypothetical protein
MDTNTSFDLADEMLVNTHATVERCGYQLMAVMGSGSRPSWQYTIGLPHIGHPELLVIGLVPEQGAGVISHIRNLMVDGDPPALGFDEPHELRGSPFRVLPVPDRYWAESDLFAAGINYWGSLGGAPPLDAETLAWQVVWSDRDDQWPWDEAFDPSMRLLQPVLCLGHELGDAGDAECGHCDCEICQIYGPPAAS